MEFQTYRDGNIQHSYATPVLKENWIDCLNSLVFDLMEKPEHVEIIANGYDWPRNRTEREDIIFATSLIYKEEKPAWYCLNERKFSKSESKKHDKRWEEIASWMDGTNHAIGRILGKSHFSCLNWYSLFEEIRSATNYSWVNYEQEIGFDIEYSHRQPFDLINMLIEINRLKYNVERNFESFKNNLKIKDAA